MRRILENNRGLSLIELVVTMVILGILASMILPSATMTATRVKEMELKRNLREIRSAIDEYKKAYDKAVVPNGIPPEGPKSGYPKDFKELTEGHNFGGLDKAKTKFLRRVPPDPFHPLKEGEEAAKDAWNMRSTEDDSDSRNWGEQDLFDVSSKSDGIALDGTKYKDW
jgi:general secretion pathway protein G